MAILNNLKRVLILRCGALGDLVYATAIIDALQMQYGKSIIIDFITTPGAGKLFDKDPRINRIFPLKHKKVPSWVNREKKDIIRHAEKEPYDLTIILDFDKNFKRLASKIQSNYFIGMGFSDISHSNQINRADYLKLFYQSIFDPKILLNAKPKLFGTPIETLLPLNLPKQYILIAPSNSHNQKKGINYRAWPFEHWRELIQKLSHIPIVILGAKGEELFFNKLKPYNENIIDLVGKLTITDLITVVKHGSALICTDSATGHIGAAVDTPTFVIMGPNDPATDSPYQSDTNLVRPISLHLPCSPCYKTNVMKSCQNTICMSQITPDIVINILKKNIYTNLI